MFYLFFIILAISAQQSCNITRTCGCDMYCDCEGFCQPYKQHVESQIGYFRGTYNCSDHFFIDYNFDDLNTFLSLDSTSVDAFNGYFVDSGLVQASCDFWQVQPVVNTSYSTLELTDQKVEADKFLLQYYRNSTTEFCIISKDGRRAYREFEFATDKIFMLYPNQASNFPGAINLLTLKAVDKC